jgi:hypothetical protein
VKVIVNVLYIQADAPTPLVFIGSQLRGGCRGPVSRASQNAGNQEGPERVYNDLELQVAVSSLGGVVVSVLVIGPKGRVLEPGQGDGL